MASKVYDQSIVEYVAAMKQVHPDYRYKGGKKPPKAPLTRKATVTLPSGITVDVTLHNPVDAWQEAHEAKIREYAALDVDPSATVARKPRKVATDTSEIDALRAENQSLRDQLAAVLRTSPEPDASPLPDNYSIEPWTRDDGREYVTLCRTNRKGSTKRFAVPREYVGAVSRSLVTA